MFTSEEPTRFGIGCLGSRALCGALTTERMATLRDAEGRGLDEIRRAAGFSGELSDVRLPEGYYSAFVELHIEQGPILEREGLPIGIVTAIAAPSAMRVTWQGEGGHAGAVLMPGRRDALCAAADAVLAVEAAARSVGGRGQRRDHGRLPRPSRGDQQHPRSGDARDRHPRHRPGHARPRRRRGPRAIDEIAGRRRVRGPGRAAQRRPARRDGSVPWSRRSGPRARDLGLSGRPMISRAYHDSLFMARVAPTGMIFIPCKGGISHRPEESSEPEEIARGIEVLR